MSIHYPEGSVLLRNLSKNYPVCTHGKGIFLFDEEGKKYIDASGGALVGSLGHGNEKLADQIFCQMKKVAYVNGMQFTTRPMEEAAHLLSEHGKRIGLNKVSFLASGSEAIEAAIKFCRQLWFDRGIESKHKIISRSPGYHGNTLYALSASGRPHYKKVYGPLLSPTLTVTAPYGYRAPFLTENDPVKREQEYLEKGADFYGKELELLIEKEGADSISCFLFETVSGSSTGGWVPPNGYFDRVSEICKKHQILMIADEVMVGAGRTDLFFAAEHFNLKPDVIVLGKSINAGFMPVSALIVKEDHVNEMKAKSGGFMHAQTYMQAPSMAATVHAVLSYMKENQTLENAKPIGDYFQKQLRQELAALPFVGSVTGIGHIAGVEFVKDKLTCAPFPIQEKKAQKFVEYAQKEHGIILWPNYGQADGVNGDLVMLGPSLEITKAEVDLLVGTLKSAIQGFFT